MRCEDADDISIEGQRRLASNEVALRRVNEAIVRGCSQPGSPRGFVCECGRYGCNDIIELPLGAYHDARRRFDTFLVVPGHQTAVDRVLERHCDHFVVVKAGVASELARDDARRGAGKPRRG